MESKLGFTLLLLLFTCFSAIAQVNDGKLYKLNTKISISLLNYELKGEYSLSPKFLATLGVGYGMAYISDEHRRFDMYQNSYAKTDKWLNFGYPYFTFIATADFKYYILKKGLILLKDICQIKDFIF